MNGHQSISFFKLLSPPTFSDFNNTTSLGFGLMTIMSLNVSKVRRQLCAYTYVPFEAEGLLEAKMEGWFIGFLSLPL